MSAAGPTSSSSRPALLTQNLTAESPANNMSKQSFPCYYFQKGQCLKGETCNFVHGPQASGINVAQQTAVTSKPLVQQQYSSKKDQRIIKDKHVQQNISKHDHEKLNANSSDAKAGKPAKSAENLVDNVHIVDKRKAECSFGDDLPSLQKNNGHSGYSVSEPWINDVQPLNERHLNRRETDEILRESSPGFDVLVGDDIENPNFFHGEDDFRRIAARDGRTMNFEDDHEYNLSDYGYIDKFERGHDLVGIFDQDGQLHDTYNQERSFTRNGSGVSSLIDRRTMQEKVKSDEMDGSDLRHHILKQRRLNGSRDAQNGDEGYRCTHSPRDQNKLPYGNSIRTRLQGRIKFPRRYSTEINRSSQTEEDSSRRSRGRLMAAKPIDYQGRHLERTNWRTDGHLPSAARNRKRYGIDSSNFAGPKSLAELKGVKIAEKCTDSVLPEFNDSKSGKLEMSEHSEDSSSHDPNMMSILKRKREANCSETPVFASEMENRQGGVGATDVYAALTVKSSADPAFKTKRSILELNESEVIGEEQQGHAPQEDQENIPAEGEELDAGYDDDEDNFARKVSAMFS